MKLTLQLQLLPDDAQDGILRTTVERFNAAANWLAGLAFEARSASKYELQKRHYRQLRDRFGLPADMAIRCIAQVCEAYKRDKDTRPAFRPHAAVPYSHGKNYGFKGVDRVSLSTLQGRVVVTFLMGAYQRERFGFAKGQADLILRDDGKWFLLVTVDLPDGTPIPATEFIGVDLGVENIAADSDGTINTSAATEKTRRDQSGRRRRLGKATRNASRKKRRHCHKAIVRMRRKESRFRRDVNHVISKRLVETAKRTARGIALENLKGIRERVRLRKSQRARHGSWAFHQLRSFVEYKASLAGVPVVCVDPKYTSQTCSACGHCERSNRVSQSEFICRSCGFALHADLNAARNLASKGCRQSARGSERPSVA